MQQPLVSIITRTCQRPEVLKGALNSIREQTYKNIQVIIIEDGKNESEAMLAEEYPDLNYVYEATGKKMGRCVVGNRGLELASGEYINFLDDDDLFFPNHVQLLVNALLQEEQRAAYAVAEEHQIVVKSENPYRFKIKKNLIRFRQPFNRLLLYTSNYIPIQSIMFQKSLYKEFGGFDHQLDTLEDWDLWVRYSTHTDYVFVNQVTSCYHTPYKKKDKKKRSTDLKKYLEPLHEKFKKYGITLSVEDLNRDMIYVIREYKDKRLIRYLRIFFRVVFLGER